MPILHTEGRQFILDVAIRQAQAVPAAYYLGWCTDTDLDENASLTDLTELSGNGYGRIAINSDNVDWTSAAVGTNAWKVTSKTCTFTASGGNWSASPRWFLATTADDSGKLIASGPLNSGSPVTLLDHTDYDVAVVITLTVTSGWVQEGLQYMLEVAFTETQSVPANFYRGLAADTSLASDATLASIAGELSGNGYARGALVSGAADWTGEGAGDGDYQLVSEPSEFLADGAAWAKAMIEFLTTSADGSGVLLGWRAINSGSGYALPDTERYDVETSLLLTG
jgi:hypothetical protein